MAPHEGGGGEALGEAIGEEKGVDGGGVKDAEKVGLGDPGDEVTDGVANGMANGVANGVRPGRFEYRACGADAAIEAELEAAMPTSAQR